MRRAAGLADKEQTALALEAFAERAELLKPAMQRKLYTLADALEIPEHRARALSGFAQSFHELQPNLQERWMQELPLLLSESNNRITTLDRLAPKSARFPRDQFLHIMDIAHATKAEPAIASFSVDRKDLAIELD